MRFWDLRKDKNHVFLGMKKDVLMSLTTKCGKRGGFLNILGALVRKALKLEAKTRVLDARKS